MIVGVGAGQLGAGWAGWLPSAAFVGAVLVSFGCVVAGRAVGVAAGYTVVVVLTTAVVGGYLVSRTPERAGLGDVLSGALPRLLTAARPAPATAELLAPGVLLVVVVALVVALSVVRGGRVLVVPAAGGAVLYTAGALLTAGRADRHGLVALVLVVLVAIGWLVIDRPATKTGSTRASLVPPAALLAGLGTLGLAAGVFPATNAFEPRTLVTPLVSELALSSPLPQLASWAAAGDRELFRVRGPEVPLRLVALADYTGASWRAGSLYGPIGAVAAPDLPPGARATDVDVEVTIDNLTGSWLPTAGRPTATSADAAMVDPDSGSLVLPAGLRRGLRYDVRCTVDVPDDNDLLAAAVPNGAAARGYLALPGLPFSLAEYARRTVVNARTPYEQAVAIEEVVRAGRRPDAEAPVGSSYARLETFLFGADGQAGANVGTAEQFASAFAVLGRAVGLPARVVVGFRPVPAGPDGVAVVRGSDATAWPEVYFAGWGWVPFDPVAGTDSGPSAASKREVLNRLATPTPSTPATTGPPLPSASPAPSVDSASPGGGPAGKPWYTLLVVAAVPIGLAAVLGALRAGRRSRLRRAGATGAWTYVLDSLLLAGRTPARHRPAPDVARDLASVTPAATPLAELADRAAFAPDRTPPTRDAWLLALQVRAALRRAIPWYRRMFWPVDPRPLRRR